MRDLTSGKWMAVKAILFVAIGIFAGGMLIADSPTLKTAALLCLTVWAFARAYYFVFYVIEKYVEPGFRFSGLGAAATYFVMRRAGSNSGVNSGK